MLLKFDFKEELDIADSFSSREIMVKDDYNNDNYLTYIELDVPI